MNYIYCRPNNCLYYENGYCTRQALMFEECPAFIRWNDDNSNNTLCDFAGYEPKPIEEKWEDKIMYDDHPMGIPSDWDD